MKGFAENDVREACIVQWQAETLAGVDLPRGGKGLVPPRWTAWLLMEKAGIPRALVAYVCLVGIDDVRKGVRVAKALMLYAPYAARIEKLSAAIPRFSAVHIPATRPVREASCVAPAG